MTCDESTRIKNVELKKKYTMKGIHLAMALLMAVFSACSNNETISQELDNTKSTPMVITTNLNGLTASRAGITNDNLTGYTFLFSSTPVDEPDGSNYIYKDLLASYSSDKWSFTKDGVSVTPVWKDKTTTIKVTALRAATPNNDVYSLESPDATTDIQANDWLYFSGTINPTLSSGTDEEYALVDGMIPVNFKHINSKIDINLSFKDGLGELGIESVVIDGTKTAAKIADGVPTVTGDETTSVEACKVTEQTHNYEVILLPQTATLDVTVTAKDNVGNTHVFNWASSSSVTLASGTCYTLSLTLDYSQVNGVMATRGTWNSVDKETKNAY